METILEKSIEEQLDRFLNEIRVELNRVKWSDKEVLTFSEAAEFLRLSKSALYKLTSKREIPFYSPGGKMIYFKKSEIETWIFKFKVVSRTEINTEVDKYLAKTSKSLLL